MSIKQKIINETKELGIVTAYFLFCFGTILVLKKLWLEEYRIEFQALGMAAIGALIAAKVVLLLEATSIGRRFEHSAQVLDVLYKSLIYTFFAVVVLYLEQVIDLRHEFGGIRAAFINAIHHRDINRFFATLICVGVSFLGYNILSSVSRHLGEGELFRLFFSSRKAAP